MADITEAQARSIVEYAVITLNEFEKYLSEADQTAEASNELHTSFKAHTDKLIEAAQACGNDFAGTDGEAHHELEQAIHSSVAGVRSNMVSVKAQAAALLTPALRVLGQFHGFLETSPTAIIEKLSEYYRESGRRVQKRGVTINSPTAGHVDGSTSNVGTGTVYTCGTDENGDPIDNLWPETVEFKCIGDEHSGASEHRERFSIQGEPADPSGLSVQGSGNSTTASAITPSDSILLNSSFTSYSGSTFSNWTTAGSGTVAAETSASHIYRDSTGESTPVSVKFTGTAGNTLTQTFSARRLELDPNVPYYVHLAYKPASGTSGNLSFKMGNGATRTVALSGSTWKVHHEKYWFSQVNKEDPTFVITVDSLASSGTPTLHIDDLIVAPMSTFNNLYYCIIGGATPFLKEDRFTVDVQPGTAGVGLVNEWLWKAFNMYLPCETTPGSYTEGSVNDPPSTTARDWQDPSGYS